MNPNIYLLSETEIKTGSTLFNNVEYKMIKGAIRQGQKHILNILGTGLYNEIETQVNLSALTANNSTLFNQYVKPCLLNYVIAYSVKKVHYKLAPTGVQVQLPNDSQPANDRQLETVINDYIKDAESDANTLRNYLITNSNIFPLFNNPGSSYDTIHPNQKPYFSGLYLGNTGDNYSVNRDINL